MIPLSLGEIAAITGGEPRGQAVVTGPAVIDSRRAVPGSLFAAIKGEHADGHDYAAPAMAAGAAAVLATRPVGPGVPCVLVPDIPAALAALASAVVGRLPRLAIAGITGSSGKTSTKDLTAQLAERLGPTVAPEGSFNNELGHPLTVLRADGQTRYLVLELSARGPGHIAALCAIAPPRIGAVLNVGRAHAGEFGSLEAVTRAKGELPAALPPDGVAILNAADPRVLGMAARTPARVVTFSAEGAADVRAADVRLDELARPSFTLIMPGGSAPVRMRLHGAHHVPNALAAAAIASELGMPPGDIAGALSAATARSKWRMETTRRGDGVLVVNDAYNANPESVRAAIDALGHLAAGGRGFAVLGPMAELGEISVASHEEVGQRAARAGVAALIAVGEDARPVLAGARREPGWQGEALAVPDAAAAVAALRNRLRPGDVVLVKASRVAALWEAAAGLLTEVAG